MTMTPDDLRALLPLLILAGTIVAVMLAIAWRRSHGVAALLSAAGLSMTVACLPAIAALTPRPVTSLLVIDGFFLFFAGLIGIAGLVVVLLSYGYSRARGSDPEQPEELYLLVLLGILGALVLSASRHFASLFLGIELLSVSLYALIAYPRQRPSALEAGIKYLILAAASSAFLLFGMALIYTQLGSLEFESIGQRLAGDSLVSIAGIGLMIVGIGFKLAVVPFHLWTPDVYAGAPAPVTAFIASVSKTGVFAVALRFVLDLGEAGRPLFLGLSLIAIASMLVGNLLALLQSNVKRLLAYSSIAHLGYALVALLASGSFAAEAAIYYMAAYVTTILAAFGVVTTLSTPDKEAETLECYRGLFWRRPWIAAVFTASLLSLAGIPLTAGFLGKFYILLAAVESAAWPLVFTLVVGSVLGLFYYLRVVVALFSTAGQPDDQRDDRPGWTTLAALTAATVPLFWLGILPEPILNLIQRLIGGAV